MAVGVPQLISYGRRVSQLAETHPERPAIIFSPADSPERVLTWGELDRQTNQLARLLQQMGVGSGSMVMAGLPNSPELVLVAFAVWKVGGCVLTCRAAIPDRERDAVIEAATPTLVVADWENVPASHLRTSDLNRAGTLSDAPLPDCTAPRSDAKPSGGSTGRPKVIVTNRPGVWAAGSLVTEIFGHRPGQTQLVGGSLYHAAPWASLIQGMLDGHKIILMDRFDAARFVDLTERHRVQHAFVAPIMMQRIIRLPGIEQRDFSSLYALCHAGSQCPVWLKRDWIALLGPERVYEYYGMTEGIGIAAIRGEQWLKYPGSVGKPMGCDLQIRDADGRLLPPGETGDIWLRSQAAAPRAEYLNAPPIRSTPDGFATVGDLGWVDEEGNLYISDRRVDMIVTGGANVFPAEVEAALSEHTQVADVAVIGVPDPEWGRRVHAIIQPRNFDAPPPVQELDAICRKNLSSYKVPKTYEFSAELPRMATGKLNRGALIDERSPR